MQAAGRSESGQSGQRSIGRSAASVANSKRSLAMRSVVIVETVVKRQAFSDAQQAVLHNNGPETEIGYRLAWARTYLTGTALLTEPYRTDDQGREQVRELWAAHLIERRKARRARTPQDPDREEAEEPAAELSWKEQLLGALMTSMAMHTVPLRACGRAEGEPETAHRHAATAASDTTPSRADPSRAESGV